MKPNYQYDKRQRDLAKKRKKEEKLQSKLKKHPSSPEDAAAETMETPLQPPA
jgi:hypothetical protein